MNRHLAIFAKTSNTSLTKSYLGQEYLVVPVVAMVEGVRFGANQNTPELGLASEFGKYPVAWNNKPLTVGHPQIDNQYVSANELVTLETFSFGMTMNARVESSKLKMEAWINLARVADVPGAQEFVDRIQAGDVVEVSVGFFTDVEDISGTFKNQEYRGVWKNIVPDHLAFLTQGVLGACSVADGCGVPRINRNKEQVYMDMKIQCGNDTTCGCKSNKELTNSETQVKSLQQRCGKLLSASLHQQSGSTGILNEDVYSLLRNALYEKFGYWDVYVYGFTSEKVVFERSMNGIWKCFQITYTINQDATVQFDGVEEEVILLTKVLPYTEEGLNMTTQETITPEVEGEVAAVENTEVVAPVEEVVAEEVVTEAVEPVVNSLDDALKALPEKYRSQCSEGLKIYEAQKATLIKALKATNRCVFDDTELNEMTLQHLTKLSELAKVPSYEARQAPTQVVQESKASNGCVEVLKVFQPKIAS